MYQIRIHGRGGQGGITTGQIMATAAFYDGKQCQTFPMFGVERAGAPVTAFCRIDTEPIHVRSQVYHPNAVLVLDSSLIDVVDVTLGLVKGGTVIVNSNKPASEIAGKLGHKEMDFDVHCVDATSVALKLFSKAIVNTPMLGAFSKTTKQVSLKSLKKGIDDVFLQSKGKAIAQLNKKAVEEVYKLTK